MCTGQAMERGLPSIPVLLIPRYLAEHCARHSTGLTSQWCCELIGDTLRAIFEYAKYDRSEFIDTITMAQSTQEDAEVKKVRARIAVAGNRCEELEKLICRIYEDNILGKLPDSRYEVLDKQYAREKAELDAEIKELEAKLHRI